VIDATILNERIDNIIQLIKAGADISRPYPSGETPLCTAAMSGSYEVVYVLLENGADPAVRDYQGRNIMDQIRENGARGKALNADIYIYYEKTVALLKSRGLL